MLRHRSSLERHFTPKTSAICFPSVKGRFCSPSVLIYREVRVRTHALATKKRPTGVDRFLFYGGPSGVQPAPQAAAAALSRLARCAGKRSRVYSAPRPDGFEPVSRQQKSDQPESIAFHSMMEHPRDVSELTFLLPFMLSKYRSTSAAPCFEDLPCLSLLLMSVRK